MEKPKQQGKATDESPDSSVTSEKGDDAISCNVSSGIPQGDITQDVPKAGSWFGSAGWGTWITSVQTFGSLQIDKLYDLMDPTIPSGSEPSDSEPRDSERPSEDRHGQPDKYKRLFDNVNSPSSPTDTLISTFDVAADALGAMMNSGLKKIEETTGYRIEPTPLSLSSQSSTKSTVLFDTCPPEESGAPPHSDVIKSVSKQVVMGSLSALEKLGKTTADIVTQTRDIISPAASQKARPDVEVKVKDLSLSAIDLFSRGTGPSDLEDLQLHSTECALKVKTKLKSMSSKSIASIQPKLDEVSRMFSVDKLPQGAPPIDEYLANLISQLDHPRAKEIGQGFVDVLAEARAPKDLFVRTVSKLDVDMDSGVVDKVVSFCFNQTMAKILALSMALFVAMSGKTLEQEICTFVSSLIVEINCIVATFGDFVNNKKVPEEAISGLIYSPAESPSFGKEAESCITVLQDSVYCFVPIVKLRYL